jgi:hypothetical protein
LFICKKTFCETGVDASCSRLFTLLGWKYLWFVFMFFLFLNFSIKIEISQTKSKIKVKKSAYILKLSDRLIKYEYVLMILLIKIKIRKKLLKSERKWNRKIVLKIFHKFITIKINMKKYICIFIFYFFSFNLILLINNLKINFNNFYNLSIFINYLQFNKDLKLPSTSILSLFS